MPGHPDLPRKIPAVLLSKSDIFDSLKRIDEDPGARGRILQMESALRGRVNTLIGGLPRSSSVFAKFNTNPFVLMFYARQKLYSNVYEVERDLLSAKVFSSMETSAGNMIEKIALPIYGWEGVDSSMHSHESLLDGRRIDQQDGKFVGVTLKSGPRTLNDDMARNIANELVDRSSSWAVSHRVDEIDFTYGVLYGTKKQSNKKDWHILRNIDEMRPSTSELKTSHRQAWSIAYSDGPLTVSATVRVGLEWWEYLGGKDAWLELCCALIRSCIAPARGPQPRPIYTTSDLSDILDLSEIDDAYNVSLLQRSQLEWLLFLARHFCDGFRRDGASRH